MIISGVYLLSGLQRSCRPTRRSLPQQLKSVYHRLFFMQNFIVILILIALLKKSNTVSVVCVYLSVCVCVFVCLTLSVYMSVCVSVCD